MSVIGFGKEPEARSFEDYPLPWVFFDVVKLLMSNK